MNYTVGEQIGEGADALIYSGHDDQNNPVVVKIPKDKNADLSFRLEKEVFRQIDSPHIPRLLGYVEHPSRGMVLVLERLYPNPLQSLNKRKTKDRVKVIYDSKARYVPLPGLTALELSRELLLCIEIIHKAGFVHCDVKLSNLMVRLDNREGVLSDRGFFENVRQGRYRGVLIDGGAVRSASYLQSLNSGQEDKDVIPPQCTPVYSPPEVVLEPHQYTASMDIYAAALVIYTFLTGHAPYSHIQRKLDATDLLSVWEFKLAENRGEISPVNFEVIQNVFYPDSTFARGSKARTAFDHKFYTLLKTKTSGDIEERGDISTFVAEFTELFAFKSNRMGANHIRVASSQGIFDSDSSLQRFVEAGKEDLSPTEAMKSSIENSEAPMVASRAVLRTQVPAQPVQNKGRPGTYRLNPNKIPVGRQPTPRTNEQRRRNPTARLTPRKPKKLTPSAGEPRRRTTSRRMTNKLVLPKPKESPESPKIVEGVQRLGERLDRYFKDAEQGQEHFLRKHAYPVFYLEEHGQIFIGEDAPTTTLSRQTTPPDSPCILPLRAEGRPNRGISVGRADARDVQIHCSSVSKLHAALAIDPQTNKWMFSDLGSTNGSWVQGHKLMPLVPALLENLCRVQLGGVKLVFFSSKSFYEYLVSMI